MQFDRANKQTGGVHLKANNIITGESVNNVKRKEHTKIVEKESLEMNSGTPKPRGAEPAMS